MSVIYFLEEDTLFPFPINFTKVQNFGKVLDTLGGTRAADL